MRDIAAEIRRRPVGAVLADICRDLGIVPSDPLWRELALAVIECGGNFAALFEDTYKRVSTAILGPPAVDSPAWPPSGRRRWNKALRPSNRRRSRSSASCLPK